MCNKGSRRRSIVIYMLQNEFMLSLQFQESYRNLESIEEKPVLTKHSTAKQSKTAQHTGPPISTPNRGISSSHSTVPCAGFVAEISTQSRAYLRRTIHNWAIHIQISQGACKPHTKITKKLDPKSARLNHWDLIVVAINGIFVGLYFLRYDWSALK